MHISASQLFGWNNDFGFLENRFDAPIMPHLPAESAPKFRTGHLDFKMHKMFSHDMYGSF